MRGTRGLPGAGHDLAGWRRWRLRNSEGEISNIQPLFPQPLPHGGQKLQIFYEGPRWTCLMSAFDPKRTLTPALKASASRPDPGTYALLAEILTGHGFAEYC